MVFKPGERLLAGRLDNLDPALFGPTPSQTVGPFFHFALPWKGGADLVGRSEMGARPDLFDPVHDLLTRSAPTGTPLGETIELSGRVLDGAGVAVSDAMIEIWQADAMGRYPGQESGFDPHFVGFGRAATDGDGVYRFRTVMPGRVASPDDHLQAAHIEVSVFGRGLINRLATRIYFAGSLGLDADPVLACVPAARRVTLIAEPRGVGLWWRDIVLSGEGETVFFAP